MTIADDPYGSGGAEDDGGDDGTAPSSSSTSPTALPTICFVTPLKKLRLSPAFSLQKGDGGQDDHRPVKVIGDDAHEEEPAKAVSCCMVNYSPFASPAVLLPHHSVNNSFSSHGLLRFDTLTAVQQIKLTQYQCTTLNFFCFDSFYVFSSDYLHQIAGIWVKISCGKLLNFHSKYSKSSTQKVFRKKGPFKGSIAS